jgi:hypothetical protein
MVAPESMTFMGVETVSRSRPARVIYQERPQCDEYPPSPANWSGSEKKHRGPSHDLRLCSKALHI